MYRYISRESCSQFDSLPLTSLHPRCSIAELHASGVVHCDVKSRNVIRVRSTRVTQRDPLCLCDLDAALLVGAPHDATMKVSCLLYTVTFYVNHAHNLTRSP
jgi:tRNA A-37 threonylcarbamoyl transferase component Bud32